LKEAHPQRTEMSDTTQQHSADAQWKPREEDLLQTSQTDRNVKWTTLAPCHFADWAVVEAKNQHRTIGAVPQNAASQGVIPPDAVNASKGPSSERAEADDAIIASVRTQETATMRTPHPHDVLFGGNDNGRIFHHAGNVQFRVWVAQRSTSYRLASKWNGKKTRVIREVTALVKNQNPPGLFLKRDPTDAGWWAEVGDRQTIKNIRIALRRKYDKEFGEKEDGIAPISTPHSHDVILGRGGMSNHHPW
jgi:hypothetical protein